MRPISVHVDDEDYRHPKALADRSGRPVAELIRDAMAEYLAHREGEGSLLEIEPHPSGALLRTWNREELFDEMLDP
jgi:ribbon-helix-helix CopG family protein